MLSTNPNYQIVKAHNRRGWRVNRWDGYGWIRATDTLFASRAKAQEFIDNLEE